MRTQYDNKQRIVALSNLRAMCKRTSGTCHRYTVTQVTPNRVHVEYSNPDEYANEHPMTAVFPAYPWPQDTPDACAVVLSVLRIIHDSWDGEGWQGFVPLLDCPPLFRSSPDSDDWRTREEIEASQQQTA